jgi:hypothetical protein
MPPATASARAAHGSETDPLKHAALDLVRDAHRSRQVGREHSHELER